MEYLIKHITVKEDKPILIQLQNHQSRSSLKVLNSVTDYGAVLLSFPQPTTLKLKSLARSNASGARLTPLKHRMHREPVDAKCTHTWIFVKRNMTA
jgi:hypothetical protein